MLCYAVDCGYKNEIQLNFSLLMKRAMLSCILELLFIYFLKFQLLCYFCLKGSSEKLLFWNKKVTVESLNPSELLLQWYILLFILLQTTVWKLAFSIEEEEWMKFMLHNWIAGSVKGYYFSSIEIEMDERINY